MSYPIKNAVIIGSGIAGLLAGYFLHKKGIACTIIEKSPSLNQSCSYMAAGMLAPLCEAEVSRDLIYQLGQNSLELWPKIEKDIGPCEHQQNGSLLVWHKEDYSEAKRFFNILHHKNYGEHIQHIYSDQLQKLEPELAQTFQEGFYIEHEGGINPRVAIQCLYEFLKPHITFLFSHDALSWDPASGDVLLKPPSQQETKQTYDLIVDCRGTAAHDAYPDMRGVKGEAIIIHAPEVHLSRPIRLMHPRYPLYIMPRQDQHYLIGATQIENEHHGVTLISALELLTGAYSLHPGFSEAQVIELLHHFRPTLKDGDPRAMIQGKCLHINGFYRHGFLIGPAFVQHHIEKVLS